MKTNYGGWMGWTTVGGLLLWGAAGSAWATSYIWDGSGVSDASGNWNVGANWNPDAGANQPTASDAVSLGNVSAGTRTVTFNKVVISGNDASSLTLTQNTAGAVNKLLLADNFTLPQPNNVAFVGTGSIVVDISNKTFSAFGGNVTRNYGTNITWYSSGGTFIDTWNGSPTLFTLQGAMNLTTGTTTMTCYNGFKVDTTGTLNLTGSGTTFYNSQNGKTTEVAGVISGDGAGVLKGATIQVDAGAQLSGLATIQVNTCIFKMTNPALCNLAGTTLKPYSGAAGTLEVLSDSNSFNYTWPVLDLRSMSGNQMKLVDNYNNDPTGTGPERLVVTNFLAPNSNPVNTFDLNGLELCISNAVAGAGYTAPASYGRIGNSTGTGTVRFVTAGGSVTIGQIFISGSSVLQVIGPATLSGVDSGTPATGNGASFNGTFKFNGNITGRFGTTGSGNSLVDLGGGTLTLVTSTYSLAQASSNTALTISGNVNNTERNANTGYGLIASGMTKAGASGAPTLMPAGTLAITGSYQLNNPTNGTGDTLGATEIGRLATLKVGGNFIVENMQNNIYQTYNLYLWRVNTSQDAGTLVFNGGGTVQLWDLNSKDFLTFAGLDYYALSGSGPVAGDTVTGGSSGASATITDVVGADQLRLSGISGTFQADETLTLNNGHGTARAYNANYTGLASAQTDGGAAATSRAPYGNVSIGDPTGNLAMVKLTNGYANSYYGSVETMQVARSLTVTSNSVFDIAQYKMVVAMGTNSTIAGVITNSTSGGTLILTNGAALQFATGGSINLDVLTIASDATLNFACARDAFIRVNGDQKSAFDALIAGGQVRNTGGATPMARYNAADLHTVISAPPPAGTVFTIR